ncbi:MAG: SpoIID/LytB domain-containing protein [Armatimonadetes bacterium]|nr:SpoIID/LytB domain-containing protein [Armatimonadota bacterium]
MFRPGKTGLLVGLLFFFFVCRGAEAFEEEATVAPGTIRVGLAQQAAQVEFSIAGDYELISVSDQKVFVSLKTGERWQAKADSGRISLFQNGRFFQSLTGPLQVRSGLSRAAVLAGSGELRNLSPGEEMIILGAGGRTSPMGSDLSGLHVLSAQGLAPLLPAGGPDLITLYNGEGVRRYRGSLEIRAAGEGLTVINELPLEEYLYGVVPAEMPASWPAEALKAQAVAARSYALAQLGTYGKYGFDLLATQNSQVYKGYDGENPATTKAVQETRGVVLTYQGLPVNALFHSSSGGYTENSEDVWKDRLAYIRARPDPEDRNDRHYNWQVVYTKDQLIEQLKSREYDFQDVFDLTELERTATGKRVKRLVIKGLNQEGKPVAEEISNADRVRTVLGLKSAFFTMQKEYDGQQKLVKVTFCGNGWGHGLGMSQYGALGLARKGYSYQDILKYYYSGVTVARNYGG